MDAKTPKTVLQALDRAALFRHAKQVEAPVTKEMTNDELIETIMATPEKTKDKAGMNIEKPADGMANANMTVMADQPGLTKKHMPYLEGIRANMVNPEHKWIMDATAAEMPLKAGISGTTHRFLGLGELLGVADKARMRLAMLGHLQAIEAHSFWEICDATSLGPSAGKYIPFLPVSNSAMEWAARQTLHADQKFAKAATGEQDRASQVKRLLGTDKE